MPAIRDRAQPELKQRRSLQRAAGRNGAESRDLGLRLNDSPDDAGETDEGHADEHHRRVVAQPRLRKTRRSNSSRRRSRASLSDEADRGRRSRRQTSQPYHDQQSALPRISHARIGGLQSMCHECRKISSSARTETGQRSGFRVAYYLHLPSRDTARADEVRLLYAEVTPDGRL